MFCPLVPPWRGARTSPSRKCFPTLSLGREALLCSRGRSARLDEEAATPFDGLTAFLPAAPEGGQRVLMAGVTLVVMGAGLSPSAL